MRADQGPDSCLCVRKKFAYESQVGILTALAYANHLTYAKFGILVSCVRKSTSYLQIIARSSWRTKASRSQEYRFCVRKFLAYAISLRTQNGKNLAPGQVSHSPVT